jgi:two-component sensor histidine kinase
VGTFRALARFNSMARSPGSYGRNQLDVVRRHMRILVDLGRISDESNDFARFMDHVVMQVARAIEIDHVKILRYRPRTADLLVVAGIGWREGVVGAATLPAGLNSAPGRSFQTGQSVIIRDFTEQNEFELSPLLRQHGIVALANVPILIDGAAWGVLEVDSTAPRDFGEDTVEFLMAAAVLVGVMMERQNARQLEVPSAAALEEQSRDMLLRELQHRVKNNFQMIMSSIALQKRLYSEADVHDVLDQLAGRISAIALAHDQLSVKRAGQVVALADYIRALCTSIENQVDHISIEVEADEMDLPIDRAVSLGLILNEVATNSIKHAFGDEGGRIRVHLIAGVGYGEGRLTVADNGRGMPSDRTGGGSGLMLISALARQVGGSVTRETSSRGTITSLTFPIMAP